MVVKKSGDADQPAGGKDDPPGKVVHDTSGKAVWKWSSDSDSTSKLLKKLEVPGMSIEEDARPGAKPAAPEPGPSAREGYSPYGDASAVKPRASQPRPAQPKPASPPKPAPKRSWFKGLFGKD